MNKPSGGRDDGQGCRSKTNLWLFVALLTLMVLSGTACGLLRGRAKEPRAEVASVRLPSGNVTLGTLQAQVMRFADTYATQVAEAADNLSTRVPTPEARLATLRWKLSQSTAAFIDAAGPNPVMNALDIMVLVTLSRMVVEDSFMKDYGDAALPLQVAHRRLEEDAWSLASRALKPVQQQELNDLIREWREKNPNQRNIGAVRFREFAAALGRMPTRGTAPPTSIFSLLFLDPFASLDPTAAAIEETRLLGERAMYYSQRMPALLGWQTELLTYQLANQPESKQVLADTDRLSKSAETFAKTAEQLPKVINDQREAAIKQLFDELTSEERQTRALLADARETLNALSNSATAVHGTVQSLDEFTRYVSQQNTNQPSTNSRPFNVLEYGTAARDIGAAARDLTILLSTLNSNTAQLSQMTSQAGAEAGRIVQRTAWTSLALIALLIAGFILANLLCRFIASRSFGEGTRATTVAPNQPN
jgi:hypothetical protein